MLQARRRSWARGDLADPGDVPHEVRAGPEGAVVIDVFAPARDDWRGLGRDKPREPRWPAAGG